MSERMKGLGHLQGGFEAHEHPVRSAVAPDGQKMQAKEAVGEKVRTPPPIQRVMGKLKGKRDARGFPRTFRKKSPLKVP